MATLFVRVREGENMIIKKTTKKKKKRKNKIIMTIKYRIPTHFYFKIQ